MVSSGVRSLIPAWIRRQLRAAHRQFVLRSALRRLRRDPRAVADDPDVLSQLVYGWSNPSWVAGTEYLAASIRAALTADGPTLECGSGLSTLILGTIAEARGSEHWALEHHPVWARRVEAALKRARIGSVVLVSKPLVSFGEYEWYDPPLDEMPNDFALVLCDGPPASTPGGRGGLLARFGGHLADAYVVLFDDAHRDAERDLASRWRAQAGGQLRELGSERPFFELSVPAPAPHRGGRDGG